MFFGQFEDLVEFSPLQADPIVLPPYDHASSDHQERQANGRPAAFEEFLMQGHEDDHERNYEACGGDHQAGHQMLQAEFAAPIPPVTAESEFRKRQAQTHVDTVETHQQAELAMRT